MKVSYKLLFLLCVSWSISVTNAQYYPLRKPGQIIQVHIAMDELSSIQIIKDRIKKVYGDNRKYVLQSNNESGIIFIQPQTRKPISLFLYTERGRVVNLKLIPDRNFSQSIILRSAISVKKQARAPVTEQSTSRIQTMLKKLLANKKPSNKPCQAKALHIKDTLLQICYWGFQRNNEQWHIWRVQNKSFAYVKFGYRAYSKKRQMLLAIPEQALSPNARGYIVSVTRRRDL